MKGCFAVVFVLASICYPFGLYFIGREISIIMAVMWGLKALIDKKSKVLSFVICAMFACVWGANIAFGDSASIIAYFYPTLINFIMLIVFASSLRGEAFITTLARLKEPNLDSFAVSYTRTLTKIWCYYFAFVALLAAFLVCFENKMYWSVFCGVICYCVMGALFSLEWLYRRFVLKRGV